MLAYYALPLYTKYCDYEISYQTACIILAILGAVSGALISYFGRWYYQTASKGWPWMPLALLTPVGTVVETGAIALLVVIAVFIITIVVYGIVIVFILAVIGGILSS